MYLWILLAILLVIGAAGVVLDIKSYTWDFVGFIVATIAFLAALIVGIICIFGTVDTPREVNQFKVQKQYIETHVAKDSVENAALTTEKIKQNEWLYDAQYGVTVWHGWNFYPDSVKDLKPIQ